MRSATVVLPVPGLPVKRHVQARRLRLQAEVHAQLVDHQQRGDVADARLDRRQSHQVAVELVDHRIGLALREHLAHGARPVAPLGCAAAGAAACASAAGGALPGIEYSGVLMLRPPCSTGARAAQLVAHRVDHRLVVGAAEDRAAGHEGVGAGGGDALDVLHLDAAVDLETDVAPAGLDEAAGALDLGQRRVDEALPAKARVHAHDEHQVDLVDHVLEHVEGGRRD